MVTRQMVIIGGGESELRCGMARHSMLSERVGLCMPMHYMHESLVQNAVRMCRKV